MILEWLVNYLIHSSLLLGLAAACSVMPRCRQPAVLDLVWKAAMLAGILTASIQTFGPLGSSWKVGDHALGGVAQTPATVAEPGPAAVPVPQAPIREGNARADQSSAVPRTSVSKRALPIDRIEGLMEPRRLAIGAWSLGAGLLLLGFVRSLIAQYRMLADRRPLSPERVQALCPDLAAQHLRISTSERVANPLVTLSGEIIVPRGFEKLPATQRSAAVAHELGHLARRDPQWRLLTRLVGCVLFVQPLNRLAARNLNRAAEYLSDRYAVLLTGDRRALARSLASFAGAGRYPVPATACAMVSGGGTLPDRIRTLLENHPMSSISTGHFWLAVAISVTVGALALPGTSSGHDWFGSSETRGTRVNIHDQDGHSEIHVSHTDRDRRIELDAEGRIEFAADESDIIALSEDGYFELEVTENGTERRLEIEEDDGRLIRTFQVDGKPRPWDATARRWLAEVLPQIFRLTGIDAEARVARLLERGGPETVISEIELIESDLVARVYAVQLARVAELDAAELDVLLQTLREGIDSDLELRLALSGLMEHQQLTRDNWQTLIDASRMLGSDLEQRLTLVRAAELMPVEAQLVAAYIDASADIGSDLEARLALQEIAEHLPEADEASLIQVIEGTADIGSDLEQRLALQSIAAAMGSPAVFDAYVEAAREIGSDLEARLAYQYFLESGPPPASAVAMVRAAAETIGSDLELRLLLDDVVDGHADDPEVRRAVIDAADKIGSSHERNLLLSRLAR